VTRPMPLRILAVVTVLGAGAVATRSSSAATAPPGQVITVQVASPRSVEGILRMWTLLADGQYTQVGGPFRADVGAHGVGRTSEGEGRTPAGVFTLTRAFGNAPDNGTRLPYLRTGPRDWWDENPRSAGYNQLVLDRYSPGGNSENLYFAGRAYAHAVVINYNTDPIVRGAGSGMFLHVGNGTPTTGCVAMPGADLNFVMRWLNPALHPVISIGVGAAARAVLSAAP
jgi:L,D-peptidoglycan transpeptidase YkuD (ErfK/YbiS/YcfS/YnhG family)